MNTGNDERVAPFSATRLSARNGALHPRWILATAILASSLAFIDGSVVNVALGTIGRSLHADAGELQWIINAYLLPLSALLLLGGAAGDRFGRKRLLVAGTALFAAASAGCALAPGLGVLLASRLLQGVGAAMLMPNSLAILGATFSGPAKGRAIGIWAATGAAMGAAGPVLGGWLVDHVSWRAIFLINLPLAAGAVALALAFVPRDKAKDDRALDWLGGMLATGGLGALTWGLTIGSGAGGWTARAVGLAVVGVTLMGGFFAVEHHRGEQAMMPLALFGSRRFAGLTALTLLLYGALGGLFVLIPYELIQEAHYSGTQAGAALLPLPLLLSVASPPMGALAGRIGPRIPLTAGPLGVAAGFLLALRIGANAAYWTEVLPALLVMAIGLSAAVAPLTTAILSSVDARHTGSASGFNSAIARTGSLVATALLGSVLAARGGALLHPFHLAMLVSAMACVGASAAAFCLIAPEAKH